MIKKIENRINKLEREEQIIYFGGEILTDSERQRLAEIRKELTELKQKRAELGGKQLDEYNVYVSGRFVATSTKEEFQARVGAKKKYKLYFGRIYKQKTKNMPDSLIKDWDESMQKIRDRAKNKKTKAKLKIK